MGRSMADHMVITEPKFHLYCKKNYKPTNPPWNWDCEATGRQKYKQVAGRKKGTPFFTL